MKPTVRNRLVAGLAGTLLLAGTTLPSASAAAAQSSTCTGPVTGITFNATVTGTSGDDVFWATSGAVIVTFGGGDVVFTDFATAAVVCLGDGADWLGNSDPTITTSGRFGVRGGNGRDYLTGGTRETAWWVTPAATCSTAGPAATPSTEEWGWTSASTANWWPTANCRSLPRLVTMML